MLLSLVARHRRRRPRWSETWAVGALGEVLHTDNSGDTWVLQDLNTDEHLWSVSAVSPTECWVAALAGIVFHTIDGGATWTSEALVNDPLVNFETMAFATPGNGWAGSNVGIWHYGAGSIFEDGFESGDTSAWSGSAP